MLVGLGVSVEGFEVREGLSAFGRFWIRREASESGLKVATGFRQRRDLVSCLR